MPRTRRHPEKVKTPNFAAKQMRISGCKTFLVVRMTAINPGSWLLPKLVPFALIFFFNTACLFS